MIIRKTIIILRYGLLILGLVNYVAIAKAGVQTSGYIELQGRNEDSETEGKIDMQNATIRINAATYLWEPWIALLDGGLGFTYNRVETESDEQTGDVVTGDARLRVFPRSHFPFMTYVESRDSRVDGAFAGNHYTTRIYGASQQYIPLSGPRIAVTYRNTEQKEIREIINRQDFENVINDQQLEVTLKKNFDNHSINFESNWEDITQTRTSLEDKRELYYLRHHYKPDVTMSVDNSVTTTKNTLTNTDSNSHNQRNQLNSTVFWRPGTERPTYVTASGLFSESESTINSTESSRVETAILSLGVNHEIIERLSLRGSLNVTDLDINGNEYITYLEKIGVNYNGITRRNDYLDYNWSIFTELASKQVVENESRSNLQEVSAGLSQSIAKSFNYADGVMQFMATQRLASLNDSESKKEDSLSHSVIVGWSRRQADISSVIQLSASDKRRIDTEKEIFQLLNMQLSRNSQLSRSSSWSGNVTVQSSRIINETQNNDWQTTANIDLQYMNNKLFDVPRLRFVTEYRFLSEEYSRAVNTSRLIDERDNHYWKNRIEYNIGRFFVSLHGNITERDGDRDRLILLTLRRNFGGYYN